MSERHAVKVAIGGEEFTVRSEESPEYTRSVARYFDEVLGRIRQSLPTVDAQKAALLAGLAVTDELFQARRDDTALAGRITALTDEVARWLPPTKRGGGRSTGVGASEA